MRVPRTRGAIGGLALVLLGAWGALIPFVGPSFGYAVGPNDAWHWTTGRLWLSVIPGVVAFVGGLLLLLSARRPIALLGALLGVAAGAWYVIGPTMSQLWNHGVPQTGVAHGSNGLQVVELLGWYLGLGALILYFSTAALGRLSVRSVRDVQLAREAAAAPDAPVPAAAPATAGTAQPATTAPARTGPTGPWRRRRGGLLHRTSRTPESTDAEQQTASEDPAGYRDR